MIQLTRVVTILSERFAVTRGKALVLSESTAGAISPECRQWSEVFRLGLCSYDMLPRLTTLGHLLCLASFDAGLTRGALRLDEWAARMGLIEDDGARLRPDKVTELLVALQTLGIVDIDAIGGTFELRPDARMWSKSRPLREWDPKGVQSHLKIFADRPLSVSLSELSRERAIGAGAGSTSPPSSSTSSPEYWTRLREAMSSSNPEEACAALAREYGGALPPEGVGRNPPKNPGDSSPSLGEIRPKESGRNPPSGLGEIRPAEKPLETLVAGAVAEEFGRNPPKTVQPSLAIAKEALVQKSCTAKEPDRAKSAQARAWLEGVDKKGRLKEPWVFGQWMELCDRNPEFVLERLRYRLEYYEKKNAAEKLDAIADPIAWMSRRAREFGQLRQPERLR